jgi:hypothetical protein
MVQSKCEEHGPIAQKHVAFLSEDEWTENIEEMFEDPSCTGLNIILAKGENMLSQIPDILIRLRTRRFAWTTDISKLYNQLHLHDSALQYSLFLYDSSLSDNVKP